MSHYIITYYFPAGTFCPSLSKFFFWWAHTIFPCAQSKKSPRAEQFLDRKDGFRCFPPPVAHGEWLGRGNLPKMKSLPDCQTTRMCL